MSSDPPDPYEFDFDSLAQPAEPAAAEESFIELPPYVPPTKKRRKKGRFLFWLKALGFLTVLGLVVGLIGAAGAFFYCKPRYDLAASFDLSEIAKVEVASRIFDRNGDELGRIFVQNRRPVPLDQVSDNFINALLAAEDSRFYEHDGVDFMGIARAAYYGMRSKSLNQGASTITQQLARQTFELKDRTLSRKVTEVFLAQRIERYLASKDSANNDPSGQQLSGKQKILELYVNRIYFGSGYYGIASAAEGYFGKDPRDLSVVEAATLASCIPNPYHRSPRSFPETSFRWRNHVLERMQSEGFIDESTYERSIKAEVRTVAKGNITGKSAFVYEEVRQEVIELLGYEAVSQGGFDIHTTIDGTVQKVAEDSLKEQLDKIELHPDFSHPTLAEYKKAKADFAKNASPDEKFPSPTYLQGALIMVENKTGAIIAQVGGRDFNDSMFDRVSQGRRPTGTTFTPFVYAAAFEAGFFPGTLVDDTPMDTKQVMVGGTTGILGEWGVETFDNAYENVITSRRALARSKNAATVRIGQKVGAPAVVKLAEAAGMTFEGDLKNFNATFLGRNPASPENLCLAYTIFPNGGRRPEKSHIIAHIKDGAGSLIYSPKVALDPRQAIDHYTAYQITSVLEDSFQFGTATKAREKYGLGNYAVAGKTGTEYDFTDNWFVGYTSEVTCLVWAGFDQTESIYLGAFSSDTVLPVWTAAMNAAAKKFEPRAFTPPGDAQQVEICLKSGELACDDCYETKEGAGGISTQVRCTYTEHLRPGTSLETICHIHGKAGSRLRNLTSQPVKGPLRAGPIVSENAEPVIPIAPTVVGANDPYQTVAPVLRARVSAIAEPADPAAVTPTELVGELPAQVDQPALPAPTVQRAEPIGNNGIPVALPVVEETAAEPVPEQRVTLPPPRAIVIE